MKLTLRDCSDDMVTSWWVIERAEHDGRSWLEPIGPNAMAFRTSARFSDADVEGTSEQMRMLAEAIEERGSASFKRCAVDARGPMVEFWSPRNSTVRGECTLAEADELAKMIRERCR